MRTVAAALMPALFLAGFVGVTFPPTVYAQKAIEAQIDGEFEGWEGETVVKLMNGQIWIQAGCHYEYHYSYNADVVLYQSDGVWRMKVDGMREAVTVEHLR